MKKPLSSNLKREVIFFFAFCYIQIIFGLGAIVFVIANQKKNFDLMNKILFGFLLVYGLLIILTLIWAWRIKKKVNQERFEENSN